MNKLLLQCMLTFCVLQSVAFAEQPLWRDISPDAISTSPRRVLAPKAYRLVRLDQEALAQIVARAPMEFTAAAKASAVVLTIPMPDGTFQRFRIQEAPISAPDPSGKVSDFRSYSGQGIDDPTATLRFDVSSAGFHAQILSTGESVYLDPYSPDDTTNVISYYRRDARRDGAARICLPDRAAFDQGKTSQAIAAIRGGTMPGPNTANGTTLNTFRSAFAATGEYTSFFRQAGDTDAQAKARALAAIKTTLVRVNGIWERDAAVRYQLLADVDELKIIYTDGNTDPYTNADANALLNENQTNLDMVIGDANYDHGHVFATSEGGVGGGALCQTGQKAKGATGLPQPVGDPFDVDFVAHEVIHQWQGGHTFNEAQASGSGQCTPENRTAGTAYEPGSGSTVASYAGTCGPANLQMISDDYFHSASIAEIVAFLGNTATCAAKTPTNNTPPVVSAPASFTIPQNTPFTLTATASDADGDAITYGWEEFDLGPASPPSADDGQRPIFRPYKPTANPSRTFPSLVYILNNANTPPATFTGTSPTGAVCSAGQTCLTGEVMPVTTRTMNFRVFVRDNRAGGGGTNFATTQVNVRADSGPFVITAPNTAVSATGGHQLTVTWNVANTNAAPVSTANVKISLSTDGGLTFPSVLLASTANDGSEAVTLPNISTTSARVKVEAVGNIFFDISDANFTIVADPNLPPPTPTPTPTATPTPTPTATPTPTPSATPTPTPTATPTPTPTPTATPTPTPSPTPSPTPVVLSSISTRGVVGTNDNVMIAGFKIGGAPGSTKRVLIRGIGPSLTQFGVTDVVQDPTLELHPASGVVVSNDNWATAANANEIPSALVPGDPRESAILATLPAGAHTAILRGAGGTVGNGLVQVYDLTTNTAIPITSLSTRGSVGTDDKVMIAGLIIDGSPGTTKRVLLRGIGPSLTQYGVPDVLANPLLTLHKADGSTITNDDWAQWPNQAEIPDDLKPQFPSESVIVVTLPPGPSTVVLSGAGQSTGNALVEIYTLP